VVGALELGDARAAGEGARQLDAVVGGLGGGVGEDEPFQRGHARLQALRQLDLHRRAEAEVRPPRQLPRHRRAHGRVIVPHQERAVAIREVDVAVAVQVEEVGALGVVDEDRPGR
jgi:hypothetical protein